MDKKQNKINASLRAKAMQKLKKQLNARPELSMQDMEHELNVHEIELEMQNEELLVAQAKLKASIDEYAELFELSPTGYFILDKNGVIQKVNKRGLEQLRNEKESITGKPFSSFLDGQEQQDNFYLHRIDVMESGSIRFIYCRMKRSNGHVFDALIKSIVVRDEKKKFKHFLSIVIDITVIKERENQVVLALENANKLNEMQSRFITMASHEFRTPLTSILSCTWLVEQFALKGQTDEMRNYAARIRISVKQLTQILDEFLSQENLGSGNIHVCNDTVHLPEFCEGLLVDIQILLKAGESIRYTHTGKKEILADKKILYHIIINLLSNAVKYSEGEKDIIFSTKVTGQSVIVKVTDNGIGIPKADQPFIFNRFFRAQNSLTKQGTGLGLSIVNEYVKLINGTVSFDSVEGQGTTFVVEFPLLLPE